MAKKPSKPAAEPTPKTPAAPTTLTKVKKAVTGAAEKVAEIATDVAHAAEKHVVTPVGQAVGLVKKPKAKPVRAKKSAVPKAAAPIPPRSKSPMGKLMSKNLAAAPKDKDTAAKDIVKAKGKPKA
ncbi:hypothetical protein [Limnoglobus roseus]|uniref:Uncharacterized protein n=1 Tax=Limnoglobus roseus TaxID=2598579 RepID=A0A5C1A8N4_9BACT|nr:hypothetical protein [Limnoglobus roseus]QEL15591.1 hypothetical protein PX52LOC_02521 [Limnoglobus roseus]